MSIQDFYAAAQAKEFARDFQFRVRTLGPFTDDDLLYVKTASLPAKTIQNQVASYMGLEFNIPGSVKYDGSAAWQITFRCDEGINIRNKMENYIKEIFDDQTSTGKYGVPVEEATMDLLGKDLQPVRRYNFIGLYPVTVGEIAYNIEGSGAILELPCTFAYQWWRLVG
jgi:hypothetical protein